MCQIKSGLILKNKIICPLDHDEHHRMIIENNINDTTVNPQFVRYEITPNDGDVFNHHIKNWVFQVDQDYIPDWFDKKEAERKALQELKKWWKKRFIIDQKNVELCGGYYYLKNSLQYL